MSLFRRQEKEPEPPTTYAIDIYEDNILDEEHPEYRPGVHLFMTKRGWCYMIRRNWSYTGALWSSQEGYATKEDALAAALLRVEEDRATSCAGGQLER